MTRVDGRLVRHRRRRCEASLPPRARRHYHEDSIETLVRTASNMLKLIIVLLYINTDSFDLMKPMPPMSAARLRTSPAPVAHSEAISRDSKVSQVELVAKFGHLHELVALPVGADDVESFFLQI